MSDASLMAGHSGFIQTLASLSSLGCWGQQENRAHTPLSVHLPIPSYVLTYLPTSFHHPFILCTLSHLHNLVCHAFVPLCLSFFCRFSQFLCVCVFVFAHICCSLSALMERKGRATLCRFSISLISASVEGWVRERQVKRRGD